MEASEAWAAMEEETWAWVAMEAEIWVVETWAWVGWVAETWGWEDLEEETWEWAGEREDTWRTTWEAGAEVTEGSEEDQETGMENIETSVVKFAPCENLQFKSPIFASKYCNENDKSF